jgi:hypothetical protein
MKMRTYLHPESQQVLNEIILEPDEVVTIKGTVPRDGGPRFLETWPSKGHDATALQVFCPPTEAEIEAHAAEKAIVQRPMPPNPAPAPTPAKRRGKR